MSRLSRLRGKQPGGVLRHACKTCGAATSHAYCSNHDPDRAKRDQRHEARKAAYQAKLPKLKGRPA